MFKFVCVCVCVWGGDRRFDLGERQETKAPLKVGQKVEKGADSITTEKKTLKTTNGRKSAKTGRNGRLGTKFAGLVRIYGLR